MHQIFISISSQELKVLMKMVLGEQIKLRIPYSPVAFFSEHVGIDSFKEKKLKKK